MAKLRTFADYSPEDLEWLWPGKIPFATATGLFGAEGIAKGFLEDMLANIVTNGLDWPDGTAGVKAGSVLMVRTEDNPRTTVVRRLLASGAVLSKVYNMTEHDGGMFQLPGSLPALEEKILEIGDVRLVIVDVLADVSTVNLKSDVQIIRRKLINPFNDVLGDTGTAAILTMHTTKDGKTLAGSAGIRQALRQVLRVERDTDKRIRILSVDKSNDADDSNAHNVRYTLEGSREDHSTRVKFLDTVDSESVEDVTWTEYSDEELLDGWSREAGQTGILDQLAEAYPDTMRASELAAAIGAKYMATRVLLSKLKSHGEVTETTRGDWTLADTPEAPTEPEEAA
jgi:hypothetical protein